MFSHASGKTTWLSTKDSGAKAWWDHGATPGHKALMSPLQQGGVDLKQAPGWGSLLPSTKLGVDAGLQCPMCGGSGPGRKDVLAIAGVSSKIVSSRY